MLTSKQQKNYENKKERMQKKGISTEGLDNKYQEISDINNRKAARNSRKKEEKV